MELKNKLKKTLRNSIRLKAEGKARTVIGATRFGGKPDLPNEFEWCRYERKNCEGGIKNRPLSFIAQFNLEEISKYDTEKLLPQKGLLSFFYDADIIERGFDPNDSGCEKVFWFGDINRLKPAEFPSDLEEDFRYPPIGVLANSEDSYQDYPDFLLQKDKLTECWDDYDRAAKGLKINTPDNSSKLLGWADIIRGNMTVGCELAYRGYSPGDGWNEATPRDKQEAVQSSLK